MLHAVQGWYLCFYIMFECSINVGRIWLIDLSRSLPGAQLDGFDISSAHFPPQHELPQNVHLHTHDALQPVPERFLGKYDIVHVGRINLFVRNENPSPLLENFMATLSKSTTGIPGRGPRRVYHRP